MPTAENTLITVETTVAAPVEKVWLCWTQPAHIMAWNNADESWHTPHAENDLRVGGKFISRMEAKDGSMGFDFSGVYTEIIPMQTIAYTLDDARKVQIEFTENGNTTQVKETFEAESTHPVELQQSGWQAILNNFKKHVESTII